MMKKILYPVKVKKGFPFGDKKEWWYLYQKSDREVLCKYATKEEAYAAKWMHDWIRENIKSVLSKTAQLKKQ